jgi:sulfite reductase (NADPH) flavoprotein alpha-component
VLNNLSLAWLPNTDEKDHVHRLICEQGEVFFNWLEQGAFIYICGDASCTAADMDSAIREVTGLFGRCRC